MFNCSPYRLLHCANARASAPADIAQIIEARAREIASFRLQKKRETDMAAQGRGRERHRHVEKKMRALALKNLVVPDRDEKIKIARGRAAQPRLPFAAEPDARSVFNARGDRYREGLFLFLAARAAAIAARGFDLLAGAAAGGACTLDGEEPLRRAHPPRPAAHAAGLGRGAGLGAIAGAALARNGRRDTDFRILAREGFFEGDLHVVAQVRAAGAPARPPAAAPAHDLAE